jgi:hypothetical protein
MMINNGVAVLVNLNLPLVDSDFVRVAEDGGDFFQREAIGVGEREEHDHAADGAGDEKDEVEFPADGPNRCVRTGANGTTRKGVWEVGLQEGSRSCLQPDNVCQ